MNKKEIFLEDIIKFVWVKKLHILIFTFIIASLLTGIMSFKKIKTPSYSTSIYIEIGKYIDDNNTLRYIENVTQLKPIIQSNFKKIKIQRVSTYSLNISVVDKNKKEVIKVLNEVKNFIIHRHSNFMQYNKKVFMTEQVGQMKIKESKTNVKKVLIMTFIISFIVTLILSVFSFVMKFIYSKKFEK